MGKQDNGFDPDIIDPEEMFVTLELEDGSEMECQVLTIFEVDGQDYIALLFEEGADQEIFFYRYAEDEDGEPSLEDIETDAEFEAASQAFDELVDVD